MNIKPLVAAAMLTSASAFGQTATLPPLPVLVPVIATDVGRLNQELDILMKLAQAAEARATYWEDACRSTPECSSGGAVVGK